MKNLLAQLALFILLLFTYNISFAAPVTNNRYTYDTGGENESSRVLVINNTSFEVSDIVEWTCNYLDIKGVVICVSFQPKYTDKGGYVVKKGNVYHICLKKGADDANLIIVHELIHVKQYETNDLVLKSPSTVMYKGDEINLNRIRYDIRPYEIEAHTKDSWILREYYRHLRRAKRGK